MCRWALSCPAASIRHWSRLDAGAEQPSVNTFTIGLAREFRRGAHARSVAKHLGTDHTELRISPADALHLVPELPRWFDEPMSNRSAIPTMLVSGLARRQVTVALSGDGGDELFRRLTGSTT
jgi:asparagine synthase (glutamine-hydrolysing)